MKYMDLLRPVVEKNVAIILAEKISIIIDGWDSGHENYFWMIASCPANNILGYVTKLLW